MANCKKGKTKLKEPIPTAICSHAKSSFPILSYVWVMVSLTWPQTCLTLSLSLSLNLQTLQICNHNEETSPHSSVFNHLLSVEITKNQSVVVVLIVRELGECVSNYKSKREMGGIPRKSIVFSFRCRMLIPKNMIFF